MPKKLRTWLAAIRIARPAPCDALYSNFGFGVLGELLSERYGRPWAALVRERITAPLGMRDTGFVLTSEQRGRFAARRPLAVEVPFTMLVAGTIVRGRIDAVFEAAGGYLVVDWKTGDVDRADPAQLAIYRQAWADLAGVPPEQVQVGFFDIMGDRLVTPAKLPPQSEWADAVRQLN